MQSLGNDLLDDFSLSICIVLNKRPSARGQLPFGLVVELKIRAIGPQMVAKADHSVDLGTADRKDVEVDANLRSFEESVLIPVRFPNPENIPSSLHLGSVFVLDGGISEDEVARAKARMQSAAAYSRDSLSGPARLVGQALVTGRSLDELQAWPDRIGAVTLDQVREAATFVIHDDVAVTGILMPGPTS